MNKKLKYFRVIALVLLGIFICTINSIYAIQEEYYSFDDGFKYIINDDGAKTCTISGYASDIYTNIIPKELNGYTVTRIGDGAFKDMSQITGEVTLPSTIISIGNDAFSGCDFLTKIKLGKKVNSIGDRAFSNCTSLEGVSLGNIEIIGDEAFKGCNVFTQKEIVMPSTLKKMGSDVFAETNIEVIKFVTEIPPEVESDTFSKYSGKKVIPTAFINYIGDAWSGSEVEGTMLGDLDRNEVVNANDAAIALDLYKNGNTTLEDLKLADVNRDAVINANDAAMILDMYKNGK